MVTESRLDSTIIFLGSPLCGATQTPMWGYPVPVLGAISPFLEPFRGRLSPNIDNVSEKLTLRYPHEGPWVASAKRWRTTSTREAYGIDGQIDGRSAGKRALSNAVTCERVRNLRVLRACLT